MVKEIPKDDNDDDFNDDEKVLRKDEDEIKQKMKELKREIEEQNKREKLSQSRKSMANDAAINVEEKNPALRALASGGKKKKIN